jgi:hypothetical protein
MKRVKSTGRRDKASCLSGKLDKATIDRALDRILKAAEEINREVDDLLAKARK